MGVPFRAFQSFRDAIVCAGPTCVGTCVGDVGTKEPFAQRLAAGGWITRLAAAVAAACVAIATTLSAVGGAAAAFAVCAATLSAVGGAAAALADWAATLGCMTAGAVTAGAAGKCEGFWG